MIEAPQIEPKPTSDVDNVVAALTAAFSACPARFHDNSSALAELKADGREIVFAGDKAFTHYDGETLELSDALTRFAYDRRDLVDGRTLPRTGAGTARPSLASKSDYDTPAAKVQFIKENSLSAWERLPATGVGSSETVSKADWYRLPVAEKVRRLKADPNAFVILPDGPAQAVAGMTKVAGAKVNTALLEKQRRIRPSGR